MPQSSIGTIRLLSYSWFYCSVTPLSPPNPPGRREVPNRALCTTNRWSHRRRQTPRTGTENLLANTFYMLYDPSMLTPSLFLSCRSISWRSSAPSHRLCSHKTGTRSSRPSPTWEFCLRWRLYWWVGICCNQKLKYPAGYIILITLCEFNDKIGVVKSHI